MAMERSVLSIQSHVVHGYVGNKCATFTLQVLGFDVDSINTVHFSNHTGYPTVKGERLAGEQVDVLLEGLRANGLLRHSHVLTGYIGTATALKAALAAVRELKKCNPACIYLCDPVLGDNGKFYVPQELVDIYRDLALQHADIITPNQFEAELLSGRSIQSLQDALWVVDWFHQKGVPKIVISSMEFTGDAAYEGQLVLLGSTCRSGEGAEKFIIKVPRLGGTYTGTGDVLSALILGWNELENDFTVACEKAVAALQAVLHNTDEYLLTHGLKEAHAQLSADPKVMAACELRLIQSKPQLENPIVQLKAERLS